MLKGQNTVRESTEGFEKWMQQRLTQTKGRSSRTSEIVTIPVVVHIIHNGEELGTGKNLPDEQVISQIEVLNEDFRRLNADRINTPTQFEPIAADIEVEFVLAKRDPEGLATNGIVRVNGGKDEWELADSYVYKGLSYWPAEDYLNIWVTNLGSDFLGYAQFPISDLDGLEDASNSRLTDGVSVDYLTFGSKQIFAGANLIGSFDRGRTTTHEIGHYLGLRHIWGDGNCNVDDLCADTPPAGRDHAGLSPCDYPGPNTCDGDDPDIADMFQNFMDYTDDVCMNLFTENQKERMRIVLDSSPRRASLKNSKGAEAPVIIANDLGLRTILAPDFSVCGNSHQPVLEVRNYGNNAISSFVITYTQNGQPLQTLTYSGDLQPLDIDTLTFDVLPIATNGVMSVEFVINEVNGVVDLNEDNNQISTEIIIPEPGISPLRTAFNTLPASWDIYNYDELRSWEITTANNGVSDNNALFVEFYNYENEGELDVFVSPSFDLVDRTSAQLAFDVAYARYPGVNLEGLTITISEQCLNPLAQADTLFLKEANELSTVGTSSAYFTPESSADWRRETIDLAPYLGKRDLQIAFIAKNAYGNNLYLDNITIGDVENRIISPSPVTCEANQTLVVEVVNTTSEAVTTIDLDIVLDDQIPVTETFVLATPLTPGSTTQLVSDLGLLDEGSYNLEVVIQLPNTPEQSLATVFYVDHSTDIVPIRETITNLDNSDWIIVNPDQEITWEIATNENRTFLTIDHPNYAKDNVEDWFVSPSLDLSTAAEAILTFEVAYSNQNNQQDGLGVYISTNCGESYDFVEYSRFGDELATGPFTESPQELDWRLETIDLTSYLGSDALRIAFVSVGNNGNPLFLDDIQIYTTSFVAQTEDILFPNPTNEGIFNLRFDLNQKENITVRIMDTSGRIIQTADLAATLNQRYSFDISNQPRGLYLVQILGESFSATRRLMKNN